ncbi:LysM peptidoglycan-binding domain-containing protein, partial [Candidatus Phycosocius spiralis]
KQDEQVSSNLAMINSYSQGSNFGSYTVRGGDSLQSIAQNLWGDSGLWYKLAEANGLSGTSALIEGQTLRLPAGVVRNTYNASTI